MFEVLDLDEDLLPEAEELMAMSPYEEEMEVLDEVPAYRDVFHDIMVHRAAQMDDVRPTMYGA